MRVPWTARRSNQSILKEISPGCSLEGLMLKLKKKKKKKIQYFGHLMWRADSLEKTWILGKIPGGEGDDRGWDGWMASPTWWTWVWVDSGSWWWTGRPGVLRFMGLQSRTRLSNWTELMREGEKHNCMMSLTRWERTAWDRHTDSSGSYSGCRNQASITKVMWVKIHNHRARIKRLQ